MEANDKQVGGSHYQEMACQHWDYVLHNDLPYLEAQITRYLGRWKLKNGLEDLEKAEHYLTKLIEWEKARPWLSRVWQQIVALFRTVRIKAEEYCWLNNMQGVEVTIHIWMEQWHTSRSLRFLDNASMAVKNMIADVRKVGK